MTMFKNHNDAEMELSCQVTYISVQEVCLDDAPFWS